MSESNSNIENRTNKVRWKSETISIHMYLSTEISVGEIRQEKEKEEEEEEEELEEEYKASRNTIKHIVKENGNKSTYGGRDDGRSGSRSPTSVNNESRAVNDRNRLDRGGGNPTNSPHKTKSIAKRKEKETRRNKEKRKNVLVFFYKTGNLQPIKRYIKRKHL